MKNNTNLIILLTVLIVIDFITTYMGVVYMGAIELNPFYQHLDNIYQWLALKMFISTVCLTVLIFMDKDDFKQTMKGCLIILILLYICVVISNLVQIAINI